MDRYQIEIYRFDPAVDETESFESYSFDFEHQPTILEVLRKIRDEEDDSLAFRESCGLGKCGSCAVMMNGIPALACQTAMKPGKTLVEPLRNHEIIKDLVVENTGFHDRLKEMRTFYAVPDFLKSDGSRVEWNHSFQELNRCIGCLACESVCPAFGMRKSEFPGPALLVQLSRLMNHPFAKGAEEHVAWVDGIHNCTACMKCTKVCPKLVDPFRNAVLPLRTAISDEELSLPTMQQGLSDQYVRSGRLVPVNPSKLEHRAIDPGSNTALFLGCMMSERYPDEGMMVLDLLFSMGVKVQVPQGLVCCGGPLMWVGKSADGKEAFEKNIKSLTDSKCERVITPCTGCSLTLSKDYSDLYLQNTGQRLPFRVVDITELLHENADKIEFEAGPPTRALFHLPCHQGKGHVLLEEYLLSHEVAGIETLDRTGLCCGGMTASSNPTMAFDLSTKIIEEAEEMGADILATACVFCRDNLHRAARRKRSKVTVENIIPLLGKRAMSRRV